MDALHPRPLPTAGRTIAGLAVVAVAIVAGVSWSSGMVYPEPNASGSGSGHAGLIESENEGAFITAEAFYNFSPRALRIEAVDVELNGAELVNTWFGPVEQLDGNDVWFVESLPDPRLQHSVVPGKSKIWLVFEYDSVDCPGPHPRASVKLKVGFANPSFPPVSRWVEMEADSGVAGSEDPDSSWIERACQHQKESS